MQRSCDTEKLSLQGHRGFVLLVVLAAIVVSATGLTTLATASLHRGRNAQYAQDDLQRRCAIISCERLLLPRAAELFERQDDAWEASGGSQAPPAFIREQVRLGNQTIELLLADEDAKVNLNSLYHEAGRPHLEQTLRKLVGPHSQTLLNLNPTVRSASRFRREETIESEDAEQTPFDPPAFRTWGDVFDLSRIRLATGDDRLLATLTADITLWGAGRLNLDRATDEAATSVCEAVVSQGVAQEVISKYRDYPRRDVELLLRQEVSDASDRERLTDLIGRGSSTYSLWTEVASQQFRLQKFSVLHTGVDGRRRTFEFEL